MVVSVVCGGQVCVWAVRPRHGHLKNSLSDSSQLLTSSIAMPDNNIFLNVQISVP